MRRRRLLAIAVLALGGGLLDPVAAQERDGDPGRFVGAPVSEVVVERAGQRVDDPRWHDLVETRPGQPLSLRDVRASLLHFFNTGLFDDVEVVASPGVTLTYRLTPARTVTSYAFTGDLGASESLLRRAILDRFGPRIAVARTAAAPAIVEEVLRGLGFFAARVAASVRAGSSEETAVLELDVAAGVRSRIGRADVTGRTPGSSPRQLLEDLHLEAGGYLDGPDLERRVQRARDRLRNDGYYEAGIVSRVTQRPGEPVVDVTVEVDPGPLVSLRFEGDAIPEDRRPDLVPVAREASVDEDLLEDSKRRIEAYLDGLGHWKKEVSYRREGGGDRLTIVFEVHAGPVFRIASIAVTGVQSLPQADVESVLAVKSGDIFVESTVDARTAALTTRYHRAGFRRVRIEQVAEELPPAPGETEGRVRVRLEVAEGARTTVASVELAGDRDVAESVLRGKLQLQPGMPFYEPLLATDRDAISAIYLDRGFNRVRVESRATFEADDSRARIVHTVVEGEAALVDRILVVGNRRTSSETIERALTLKTGQPLGLAELAESQRRLRALGLFSRVTLADVGEPGETRRDLVVTVEEAPPTTIGYGAGIEAGRFLRQSESGGPASEQTEVAGRGFFEIGRRNLWGSNRSINLFTRVSLRPTNLPEDVAGGGFGFNEYRILATFREPSVLGTRADGRVTGYFEQAVRSSFNFVRRGVQAELGRRVGERLNLVGGYSLSEVRLFDERIAPEDQPDIDRLFPQVRISKFSFASRRDARDDVLDPTQGTVVGFDGDLAGRAIGSQVGFIKGFGELFYYREVGALPRRPVLATGARIGLARGFTRTTERLNEAGDIVIGPDGQPILDTVSDLPASERFFAGGDTTVRGFARDALGDVGTLDANGFPTGGNAMIVLNAELRLPVWREIGAVVFLDAGNVYRRVGDFDLTDLRASSGFGVRYKSPIGPVRVDVGFKLNRREVQGQLEPWYVVHFSIGQAF